MTAPARTETKIVLRAAPSVLERVCEQIVTQLSLHVLLNKARLCQGTKKGGEVEVALNRLTSLGIVCSLNLQVDYNVITYYFLREYADIVADIFKRRAQAITTYQSLKKLPVEANPYIAPHTPPAQPVADILDPLLPLTEFVASELLR
jgi:hypothetical protein